jgi:hypothetical protein
MIKHVSVTSQPEEGGVLAEVFFGEHLNPAQEKYVKTVFNRCTKRLDIKLARSIDGRRIIFRQLGKNHVPKPETLQQLLDDMDIGTADPTPISVQMHLKRKSISKTSPDSDIPRYRRQAVVPVLRNPFVSATAET